MESITNITIDPEKEFKKSLGIEIASLRARNKLTRKELASKSGLHIQFIHDVEHGRRNVSVVTLAKIAHSLNTTASDLLSDKELEPLT